MYGASSQHPLLRELLNICAVENLEPAKAHITFEVYQKLSLVGKLHNLKYFFNERLKMFYLTGKERTEETDNVYLPVVCNHQITPQDMSLIQDVLSPKKKKVYLFIQDRDSSSTCYCITSGLIKPDSPDTTKRKKELEGKMYHFEKTVLANRKLLYTKALSKERVEGSSIRKSD